MIELLLRLLVLNPNPPKAIPPFSLGTGFPQFDIKLAYLDSYSRIGSGLRCVIIGSSMADAALDPAVLDQAFDDLTHSKLGCFNFSLAGAKMGEIVAIGRLLEKRYHPGLVILETSPRSFSGEIGVDIAEPLLASDWFRYQMGEWNFRGWLIDNSFIYRAYLRIQELSSKMNKPVFEFWYAGIHPDGYTPITFIRNDESDSLTEYRFSSFAWNEDLRAAYLDYLTSHDEHISLIVFETPYYVDQASSERNVPSNPYAQRYILELVSMTAEKGVPLLRSMNAEGIPFTAGDWYDRAHLNQQGSAKFSRWLAEELASLIVIGK